MTVLNFAHPLTADQLAGLVALAGPVDRVVEVPCQFDPGRPFADQARALADAVGLTGAEWQTTPLAVVLPSLAPIAGVVLAEVHGRAGYFPPVVRLRPAAGAVPPRYEVAEVIDLQAVRDAARTRRTG